MFVFWGEWKYGKDVKCKWVVCRGVDDYGSLIVGSEGEFNRFGLLNNGNFIGWRSLVSSGIIVVDNRCDLIYY